MKILNPSPARNSPPRTSQPTLRLFTRIKRLVSWLLIGILVLALLGAVYQIIATALDARAYPPLGQMVDVGGYQLHLYCTGENRDGSATVIMETGLGATSATWARIQPDVAKATRVCSYDRAGMGSSDRGPGTRDAQQIAQELHTLLHNASIPGPYVLVGWSYGGLYVREFAGRYRDEVAGLVLLDSSSPDQWTSTPEGRAQFESNSTIYRLAPTLARLGVMRVMALFQRPSGLPTPFQEQLKASSSATKDWDAQSAEFLASLASAAEVTESRLRDNLPLVVLSATQHGTPAAQEQLWQGWQRQLASLSTNSRHQIVDGADHASFWRDPETSKASIAAILEVVEAARNGAILK